MDIDLKILNFVVFAIASVAKRLNVSSIIVYNLFKESLIIENYLVCSYDMLHTSSREYPSENKTDLLSKKGVFPC